MSESDESAEYGLVMPFVVCQSKGGPYEDRAFVAGWWCGQIDTVLAHAAPECQRLVFPVGIPAVVRPQLDLIAMRHGFELVEAPDHEGEFEFATFDRQWAP